MELRMNKARKYFAITNTDVEWFKRAKRGKINVWHFPPGSRPRVGSLRTGDPIIFLSYAEQGGEFLGEAKFINAKRVDYNEFERKFKERAYEVERAPFPKPGQSCWVMIIDDVIEYDNKIKKRESPFAYMPIIGLNPLTEKHWDKLEMLRKMAQRPSPIDPKEHLLRKLKEMNWKDFEDFIAHLLQIIGFEVRSTRRTRDGGVDIKGLLITDIMTMRLMIEVKKWEQKVGSEVVRSLRGALDMSVGEGGVIITTSDFTNDAINEAKRRGAIEIGLINGERLVELILKYFDEIEDQYKMSLGLRRKPLYEQFEVVS